MRYRHSAASRLFDVANHGFIFLIAASALYPFVYMTSIALSDPAAVGFGMVTLLPVDLQFDSIRLLLLRNPFIGRGYVNSVLYTSVHTVLVLIVCPMGGFALARTKLAGRGIAGMLLLVSMFVSGGLIPTFLWIRELGMLDTMWAIILPGVVSPFYVFIFRIYILTNVQEELAESVYVDGGGDFLVFFRITLPLIKPMLATIGLFTAVGMWNSFFPALIYLSDRELYPVTLFLREMITSGFNGLSGPSGDVTAKVDMSIAFYEENYDVLQSARSRGALKSAEMAFILVTAAPVMLLYPFAQRYFVKGLTIGSLKA